MSTCIRTEYQTDGKGAGRIVAKGNGKQRTVPFDHAHSVDWNHGDAAGVLSLVLFTGKTARRLFAENAKHMVEHDGRHRFVM